MEEVFISNFSEIYYEPSFKTIFMKWYPENKYMSELEFHEQLNELFNTVYVYRVDKMYIDAYDFNYPILKTSINLIKVFFAKCQVRKCVLVKSQYLLGSRGIQKLISNIEHLTNINIKILNTREEGKFWCSVLNSIKNICKDNNQT